MNWKTFTSNKLRLFDNLFRLKDNETGILLITNNFTNSEITNFHQSILGKCPRLIGGIVDSINNSTGFSISKVDGTPFHLQGRDTFKTVGRIHEHNLTQKPLLSGPFQSISKPVKPELNTPDANAFFTLSDNLAFDIHQSLRGTRLGLTAAQTIFTTNKPFTMFYNDTILTSGTVGVALDHKFKLGIPSDGLYPISEEIQISKSRGNVIVQLDSLDASKLLVDKVYGDKSGNTNRELYAKISNGDKSAIVGVMGGDISRGSLALDTKSDVKPGMTVQFFRRFDKVDKFGVFGGRGVAVSTLDEDYVVPEYGGEDYVKESEGLQVSSYGGVYYGDEASVFDGNQFCKIPGRHISLTED